MLTSLSVPSPPFRIEILDFFKLLPDTNSLCISICAVVFLLIKHLKVKAIEFKVKI